MVRVRVKKNTMTRKIKIQIILTKKMKRRKKKMMKEEI
jgi:hypothetical protein